MVALSSLCVFSVFLPVLLRSHICFLPGCQHSVGVYCAFPKALSTWTCVPGTTVGGEAEPGSFYNALARLGKRSLCMWFGMCCATGGKQGGEGETRWSVSGLSMHSNSCTIYSCSSYWSVEVVVKHINLWIPYSILTKIINTIQGRVEQCNSRSGAAGLSCFCLFWPGLLSLEVSQALTFTHSTAHPGNVTVLLKMSQRNILHTLMQSKLLLKVFI